MLSGLSLGVVLSLVLAALCAPGVLAGLHGVRVLGVCFVPVLGGSAAGDALPRPGPPLVRFGALVLHTAVLFDVAVASGPTRARVDLKLDDRKI